MKKTILIITTVLLFTGCSFSQSQSNIHYTFGVIETSSARKYTVIKYYSDDGKKVASTKLDEAQVGTSFNTTSYHDGYAYINNIGLQGDKNPQNIIQIKGNSTEVNKLHLPGTAIDAVSADDHYYYGVSNLNDYGYLTQMNFKEKKVNEIKEDCQYLFDSCHKILREMDEMNSDIQGEFHSEVTAWIKENKDLNIDLIESMIKNLNSSLINARESIKEYGMAEKYFNEAKDRENEHRVLLESKEKEKEETELNKQNIQDAIITSLEEMDDNLFYTPDTNTLSKAVEIISSYENSNDMIVFNNLFRKDFDSKLDIQKSKKLEYENRINTILEAINKLEKEYQDILSQKDMEPERDSESKQIRELLKEKGIEAVPFYKTVTFNDRLSEERKAVIESALTKAGLLDALVVSEKDYHLIKERYPELLDVVIHSEFKGNYSFNELLIEENLPKEINTEVNKILSGFGKDFVIDDNGIFCHGLIEGRGNKKASEYVGVLARKRKKEELLRNKQLEIDAQENIRQETENSLEIVLSTIEGMNEEYDSIPDLNESFFFFGDA